MRRVAAACPFGAAARPVGARRSGALMAQAPVWSTSSCGQTAETTPMELAELCQHKLQCTAASGRLVGLKCSALRMRSLVSGRLMTTLTLLAGLIGAGLLLYW